MTEGKKNTVFQAAQSIRGDEIGAFLDSLGASMACSLCGKGVQEIGCMNDIAVPISMPIPPTNEEALWFFTTMCSVCGHTQLFFAPFIARKVMEKRGNGSEQ